MTVTADERLVHGTCHHDCPDSCGWTATVRDDVAVRLRGRADHPFSAGELCPKVNRFLDRVYAPDRLLVPQRRVGPKGSGRFAPITWAEALAEIAERLDDVIDRLGPEAVMPYSSAGNQSLLACQGLSSRFFHRMGATLLERALCGPTVGAGVAMTNGTSLGLDPLELRHSRLILLWGTNTRLTNRHLWPTIEAARADGAKVVVIDPVRTITAESADEHVAPRPGTDIALMLAMMHVLVRDELIDDDWVDDHTVGFEELADHVRDWTPARAGEITGLDATVIEQLARDYGTIRPAAIRTLIGAEHHEQGAMFFRTLATLPALVGAWQHRGGGLARSVGSWQSRMVDGAALDRPDLLAGRTPRTLNMSRLGEALTDPTLDPPVAAVILWGANPLVAVPDAERVRHGLARDDLFLVVHEQFLTDTARYADLVLPATTQLEASDAVPAWGHLWLGWNEAAIAPRGEAVSNTELFRRLSVAMGYDDDPAMVADDETLLADALPDVDLDALRRDGWIKVPYPEDGRPFGDGVFPTRSGRVELVNERLADIGQPVLPDYRPAHEGPGGDPGVRTRCPLQLLTAKWHGRFLNTSYSHLPKHGPAEGGPFVELSAADAAARGLTAGATARVFNDRASLELPVRIDGRVGDGVVLVPFGWWDAQHPDGRTANALTSATLTDWGGGVAYSDTLVQVERLRSDPKRSREGDRVGH